MGPEGPWLLHVPFVSAPEMRFPEEALVDAVADVAVQIQRDAAPYSRLVIKELTTLNEARKRFSDLRRALLATSLMIGCGIRAKDDVAVFEDDTSQLPSQADQPFICPQDRSLARLMINVSEPRFTPSAVVADVVRGIEIGLTSSFAIKALRDERVALACELYTDSWFENSSAARFISLIGVLEILKDQDSVSPAAGRLIDGWLSQLHRLETAEADSLAGQLSHMKQVSISRGIRLLVSRHLGEDRGREVRDLYTVRSNLVHNGNLPAGLEQKLQRTQRIVRELLINILQAGSRQ